MIIQAPTESKLWYCCSKYTVRNIIDTLEIGWSILLKLHLIAFWSVSTLSTIECQNIYKNVNFNIIIFQSISPPLLWAAIDIDNLWAGQMWGVIPSYDHQSESGWPNDLCDAY